MDRRNLDLATAVADTERRYVAANPKSQARFEAARGVVPGRTRAPRCITTRSR
jgi:hypothetical protein